MYKGLNATLEGRRRLNIDSSTRCNLLCPGCYRTKSVQSENRPWDITDMPMEYFHSLVRPENRIFALTYNFALSDPIYSGVLIEQLEYVKDLEHRPRMILSTNGSGRSVAWWENLASLLTPRDIVEFSIDGLQDTNSIYRVNAKWDSIIEGIKTLRANSDCNIGWRYVVFEHNYHQVKEAKELAKHLHLDAFHVILGDGRTPEEMRLKSADFDDISQV